jgi:hypothetical protein
MPATGSHGNGPANTGEVIPLTISIQCIRTLKRRAQEKDLPSSYEAYQLKCNSTGKVKRKTTHLES